MEAALIDDLFHSLGKPSLLAGGVRRPKQVSEASGGHPSIPGCCRALIIPSDLCRLRPLQNRQINQERQTSYHVISCPCCSQACCQTHTFTDAHKRIFIIPPEGWSYSPSGFQQKPNQMDVIRVRVTHHWPGMISHTSSQHRTGFLLIHWAWVSSRLAHTVIKHWQKTEKRTLFEDNL